MEIKWTESQNSIIHHRKGDLLVSAGAGSGKTAVLVEHIIARVIDSEHPTDIDRLLVITYTRAAASEMKDRVRKRFEDLLERSADEEERIFLRRQLTLLNNAQISTIDSFCQKVLKELFFKVDLDPGFSVIDETECELLKKDLLKAIMEDLYEKKDPGFLDLSNRYGRIKSDDDLAGLIISFLSRARLEADPEKWFEEQLGKKDISWTDLAIKRAKELFKGYVSKYCLLYDTAVEEHFPDRLLKPFIIQWNMLLLYQ